MSLNTERLREGGGRRLPVEVWRRGGCPGGVWPQGQVISSKPVRGNVSELITTAPTDLPALGLTAERWRDESASTRMVSHEEGLNTQPASLMSNLMRPWQGFCLPQRRYLRCDWLWRGRGRGAICQNLRRRWISSAARRVRLGRWWRWILERLRRPHCVL